MEAVNVADVPARLTELVDRVEAGESVDIVRSGKLVARLTPPEPPRPGIDWEELRRFRATLPYDPTSSVVEMRKLDRY